MVFIFFFFVMLLYVEAVFVDVSAVSLLLYCSLMFFHFGLVVFDDGG